MTDIPENPHELEAAIEAEGAASLCKRFRRPPLSSKLLREAYEDIASPSILHFIATYQLSPSDLLEQMAEEHTQDITLLCVLANNPRTPTTTLEQLLSHPDEQVLCSIASSAKLTPNQITVLIKNNNTSVCRQLTANPNLKPRHAAALTMHRDAATRLALLQSQKNLEPCILKAMTKDPSPVVRCYLASEANIEEDLIQVLADSDHEATQLALMKRKELPDGAWNSLLLSPHKSVRMAASDRCGLSDPLILWMLDNATDEDLLFLAKRSDLNEAFQLILLETGSDEVLHELAKNPSAATETVKALIRRGSSCISSLLENERYQQIVAEQIVATEDKKHIPYLLAANLLPESVISDLVNKSESAEIVAHLSASHGKVANLRPDLAYRLIHHHLPSLRLFALRSFDFPTGTLIRLRNDDPSPTVRAFAEQRMGSATLQNSEVSFITEKGDLEAFLNNFNNYLNINN